MSHLVPECYGLSGFGKFVRTLSQIIFASIRKPKLLANDFVQGMPKDNNIHYFGFDCDVTPLKSKSKELGISINSLATAAILLALRDTKAKLFNVTVPGHYHYATAFDARRLLAKDPYISVAAAGYSFPQLVTPSSTIEQVAMEVQKDIRKSVETKAVLDILELFEKNLDNLLADRTFSEVLVSISNMGHVDHLVKYEYGNNEKKLVVQDVTLQALATLGRYFGMNISSYRNRLSISSTHNSCIKPGVSDTFKDYLKQHLDSIK